MRRDTMLAPAAGTPKNVEVTISVRTPTKSRANAQERNPPTPRKYRGLVSEMDETTTPKIRIITATLTVVPRLYSRVQPRTKLAAARTTTPASTNCVWAGMTLSAQRRNLTGEEGRI